jgi:hypothetical protein
MNKAEVYFLPWAKKNCLPELIKKSAMMELFQKNDFVAVKMHFGERGGDGYVKPEFVRPFLKALKQKKTRPFLTDTNTIYHGPRNNAIGHLEVALEHGFSQNKLQVPVMIADGLRGDNHEEVRIDGKHFKTVKIATGIRRADKMLAISHFKGHILAGMGGAIKNLGMGCGSKHGKFEMHCSASPTVDDRKCTGCGMCLSSCASGALSFNSKKKIALSKQKCTGCGECVIKCPTAALAITWNEGTMEVQERFAEYAKGALDGLPSFFINFVTHITPNCDCMGKKEKPLLPDIGVLASKDPVAIDQASLDLTVKTGGKTFENAHKHIDCTIQLAHATQLDIGTREYELFEV